MSEQDLVRACLQYLELKGIPAWRQNQGGMLASYGGKKRFIRFAGIQGISDIIGLLPPAGRLIAVECKVGRNKPSEHQEAFLSQIKAAGGLAVVCYELDDLIKALG